jgi:hypothetical protein
MAQIAKVFGPAFFKKLAFFNVPPEQRRRARRPPRQKWHSFIAASEYAAIITPCAASSTSLSA